MATDKIKGKNLTRLLEELQKDTTYLKLYLPDKNYEKLTMVTEVGKRHTRQAFKIDSTEGLKKVVSNLGKREIFFEFTSKDKLKYTFKTTEEEIINNDIWLKFPDVIHREQKRKHFRLKITFDAKLYFKTDSSRYKIRVKNISQKGTLGILIVGRKNKNIPLFEAGQILQDNRLVFPYKMEEIEIRIKKAIIKRIKKETRAHRYSYAIEFVEIEKEEEQKLTKMIYRFQQEFLSRRLPI